MAGIVQVIYLTLLTWLPILVFFYFANNMLGIIIKVFAGIWLCGVILQLNFGVTSKALPLASAGITLNMLWFALLNFNFPDWIRLILIVLISIGMMFNIKLLNRQERIEGS